MSFQENKGKNRVNPSDVEYETNPVERYQPASHRPYYPSIINDLPTPIHGTCLICTLHSFLINDLQDVRSAEIYIIHKQHFLELSAPKMPSAFTRIQVLSSSI